MAIIGAGIMADVLVTRWTTPSRSGSINLAAANDTEDTAAQSVAPLEASAVHVFDAVPKQAEQLVEAHPGTVTNDLPAVVDEAELVVLAVKPQNIDNLMITLEPLLHPDTIILSVLAGTTISTLQRHLRVSKVHGIRKQQQK